METFILLLISFFLGLIAWALFLERPREWRVFANAVVPGTVTTNAGGLVTRELEADLSTRHLLVRAGTLAHQVLVGTAAKPLGVVDDTGLASSKDDVVVSLLGAAPGTVVVIASEAIAVGDDVFSAAGGKVSKQPVAIGTYYLVGTALSAADADGDELEIVHCLPREIVVSA